MQIGKGCLNGRRLAEDDETARNEWATTADAAQPSFESIALYGIAQFAANDENRTSGCLGCAAFSTAPDPKTMASDPGHQTLDCQAFAASSPAAIDNIATGRSAHAFAKTVFVATFSIAGLKGAFHSLNPILKIVVETE